MTINRVFQITLQTTEYMLNGKSFEECFEKLIFGFQIKLSFAVYQKIVKTWALTRIKKFSFKMRMFLKCNFKT